MLISKSKTHKPGFCTYDPSDLGNNNTYPLPLSRENVDRNKKNTPDT